MKKNRSIFPPVLALMVVFSGSQVAAAQNVVSPIQSAVIGTRPVVEMQDPAIMDLRKRTAALEKQNTLLERQNVALEGQVADLVKHIASLEKNLAAYKAAITSAQDAYSNHTHSYRIQRFDKMSAGNIYYHGQKGTPGITVPVFPNGGDLDFRTTTMTTGPMTSVP